MTQARPPLAVEHLDASYPNWQHRHGKHEDDIEAVLSEKIHTNTRL